MDRIVKIIAPTGRVDFIVKFVVISLLVGLVNYFRDRVLTAHNGFDSFLNNFFEAEVVAAPFLFLALAMFAHLNDLQKRLALLAGTDVLTGLANRRSFMADMGDVVTQDGVLMMVDVDHFKRVNDEYGHDVGDVCLRAIALHIQTGIREGDLCARLGGEEFAVFMPDANLQSAQVIGQRLVQGVTFAPKRDGPEIRVTNSVGAVQVHRQNKLNEVLQAADKVLYRAKTQGRARMIFEQDCQEIMLAS